MIAATVGSAVFHILRVDERTSDRLVTMRDIQNVGYWVRLDGSRAEGTDLVPDAAPVDTATFTWTEEGTLQTSAYYLLGTELKRSHNGVVITAARHASSIEFSLSGKLVTVTLISSTGSELGTAKEMTYKVWLRSIQ